MINVLDYLKSLNIENNDFLIYQGKHYKVKDILDFPYLSIFNSENISLGAQNVSKNVMGAHTGEVNVLQLKDLNTKYCLVGHSERRS